MYLTSELGRYGTHFSHPTRDAWMYTRYDGNGTRTAHISHFGP
jgi:hypothetical protein